MYSDLIKKYGSPIYVYDEKELLSNISDLKSLVDNKNLHFSYAVKANSNRRLLQIIREQGFGVDSTGIGEVYLNKDAGFTKEEMYCVGNNFSEEEMKLLLAEDINISLDSIDQIELLGNLAPGFDRLMIRINPPFGAGGNENTITGGKKTKFGIDYFKLQDALRVIEKHDMKLIGVNVHIGSSYIEHESLLNGVKFLLDFVLDNDLYGLRVIDFGGGFGLNYERKHTDEGMDFSVLRTRLTSMFDDFIAKYDNKDVRLEFEPGRYVVASAGKLIGQVVSVKERDNTTYIGTDLGFTQMIRPVLYDSYHEVDIITENTKEANCSVVGNICESGDYMCKNRKLPVPNLLDTVVVHDVGAYGYSLASNYNGRLRPIELLIKTNGEVEVIRKRETFADLLKNY